MIGRIVAWSLDHRLVVVLATALLVVLGGKAYSDLPVDAVPDIGNVQVQVLTNAPGLAPLEVEQLVTRPVELAMAGLPGLDVVRSASRAGVSAVTVVFRDEIALADARALVSQRLPAARDAMPAAAARPELGPLSSGLGEIYHFTLAWPGHSGRELRTLFDWEIAQALRTVPGVVEVNGWGGSARQVEVRLRPLDMRALVVSQRDVEAALREAGASGGGGSLESGGEQALVRFDGPFRSVADVGAQVVSARPGGVAVLVRDVATVREGDGFRSSAATRDGEGETVYGMVQMVAGGSAHATVPLVERRLAEVRARLPAGVVLTPFYVRTELVDRVLATVGHSLVEGGVVVVVVLLLLLGDLRASVVVATTIPISMLGAFLCMRAVGASGNLMSLGAVDFGLVVDGSVVVVEGMLAAMVARAIGAREALVEEGREVGGPIAFGVLIIGVVYLPVLLLEGVEGKMFRPMAMTVLFALGVAFVLGFTWVPVLASVLVRRAHEGEGRVLPWIRRGFEPALAAAMRRPRAAIALAFLLALVGVAVASGRGGEFVPRLEEGDLVIQVTRPPSVSLGEAIAGTTTIEATLRAFPEVAHVVARTGSPDVATDIMGVEQSDVFVLLRPRREWRTAHDREGLVEAMDRALRKALPGTVFSFTQPIEMRSQELLGGIKSDLGIKVFGDDLDATTRLAREVAAVVSAVPGATDVRVEPTTGLAMLTTRPDPVGLARHGVKAEDVRIAIESMRAGRPVGVLVEGERRFDVVVRLDAPPAPSPVALEDWLVPLGGGDLVPLGDVGRVRAEDGPAQVGREGARRRVLVEANVRGRDLASFVAEVEGRLDRVRRPPGAYFVFAGQYENLERATARLAIVVPLTLVGILALLYFAFREMLPAALVFANVPAAASGGVLALAARGMPLSISAAVGFIALFGVATMNGVVLLSAIRRIEKAGASPREAATRAAKERLRPVLTTAVVASFGFLPMALATGTGAEVQRPLATVVVGGLVTATLLTLGVLPSVYAWIRERPITANRRPEELLETSSG